MSKEDEILERIHSMKRTVEYRAALVQSMMESDRDKQVEERDKQEKMTDEAQEELVKIDPDLYPKAYREQLKIVKEHQIALELLNVSIQENEEGLQEMGVS